MKKYYEKHPEKLNEKKEKAPKKEKARSKKAVKNEEVEEKSETESEKESENLFDEETDWVVCLGRGVFGGNGLLALEFAVQSLSFRVGDASCLLHHPIH